MKPGLGYIFMVYFHSDAISLQTHLRAWVLVDGTTRDDTCTLASSNTAYCMHDGKQQGGGGEGGDHVPYNPKHIPL